MGITAYRRSQDILNYAQNAQGFINLHEGRVYREIHCRLSGTLNIGTAAATAVLEDAPFSLIKNLEIMVNGNVPVKTLSGKALKELNIRRGRVVPYNVAPGTATGDRPFEAYFSIPLWMPEAGAAQDATLLDATREGGVTSFTLNVDWGDASDLVTPAGTTVLSWTVEPTIEVMSHDLVRNNSLQNNYALHRERTILVNINNTNDRLKVDLLSGENRMVMSAMVIARDNGVRANDIINSLIVETDSEVRFKETGAMNQARYSMNHEIATPRTGVYFIDLAPRSMPGHGHELSEVAAYDLFMDVNGGANHQAEIIVQEIIGGSSDRI